MFFNKISLLSLFCITKLFCEDTLILTEKFELNQNGKTVGKIELEIYEIETTTGLIENSKYKCIYKSESAIQILFLESRSKVEGEEYLDRSLKPIYFYSISTLNKKKIKLEGKNSNGVLNLIEETIYDGEKRIRRKKISLLENDYTPVGIRLKYLIEGLQETKKEFRFLDKKLLKLLPISIKSKKNDIWLVGISSFLWKIFLKAKSADEILYAKFLDVEVIPHK